MSDAAAWLVIAWGFAPPHTRTLLQGPLPQEPEVWTSLGCRVVEWNAVRPKERMNKLCLFYFLVRLDNIIFVSTK